MNNANLGRILLVTTPTKANLNEKNTEIFVKVFVRIVRKWAMKIFIKTKAGYIFASNIEEIFYVGF